MLPLSFPFPCFLCCLLLVPGPGAMCLVVSIFWGCAYTLFGCCCLVERTQGCGRGSSEAAATHPGRRLCRHDTGGTQNDTRDFPFPPMQSDPVLPPSLVIQINAPGAHDARRRCGRNRNSSPSLSFTWHSLPKGTMRPRQGPVLLLAASTLVSSIFFP